MKSLIAFDLDGTLAASKLPLDSEMTDLLVQILQRANIAIISGSRFEQFEKQAQALLSSSSEILSHLYLLPTNGSTFYVFDPVNTTWKQQYVHALSEDEKNKIFTAFEQALKETGFDHIDAVGSQIEDRDTQITFSALGQQASYALRKDWDIDQQKRKMIAKVLISKLPEFEVQIGGATSIDVTKKGINKAYAMKQIMEYLKLSPDQVMFIGDAIYPGGNDYSVTELGIEYKKVKDIEETKQALREMLSSI